MQGGNVSDKEEELLKRIQKKATSLYHNARQRALDKDLEFSLSKEFIEKALKKGTCPKTGVKFDFNDSSGGKGQANPWSPSIDRKDSNKGYTEKNSDIVALIYNRAKGADNASDVMLMAKSMVKTLKK